MKKCHFILFLLLGNPLSSFSQWNSRIVVPDSTGALSYLRDSTGNAIPDFSHAGYRGGGVDIPELTTTITVSPIPGDNTAHIQSYIDQAAALVPDENGFRTAVLLDTGLYEIHGTLYINASGIVLRGVGDGADTTTNTVLLAKGNTPNQRDVIVAGGGSGTSWGGRVPNTETPISSDRILVGEYSFKLTNPNPYSPGDNIVIFHPCTPSWLTAVDEGGPGSEPGWSVNSQPLLFNRRIVAIEDSVVTVDVPVYNTLDKALSPSYIYTYDRAGLLTNIGIENLRIDIETAGGIDEAHAWNALSLMQIEDSWVKNCTFLHFGYAGVVTATATRITLENCKSLDPVSEVTGARMYNFALNKASSQVLIKNCHASNGRHHYVSNGTSWVSGNVFLHCTSEGAYTSSEGHRRWSMGLLFDNHVETTIRSSGTRVLALYNRGDYGTAHGWSAAHSVAWNCDVKTGQLVVEKPPTAQNYAIGCRGSIRGSGPFRQADGYIEGPNRPNIEPASLYEAQLYARLNDLAPRYINTSRAQNLDFLGVSLYPNPAKNIVYIDFPDGSVSSTYVKIFDLQGKLLLERKIQRGNSLDLKKLSTGIYILHVVQGQKQIFHRLFKE